MSYHLLSYFALFLPIVMVVYQVIPKRFRFLVMLAADYTMYFLFSGFLVFYLIGASMVTYGMGLWLERVERKAEGTPKEITKQKRKVLALGVCLFLAVLLVVKYFNFFAGELVELWNRWGADVTFTPVRFLIPIGLSYYTLQIISYLTDVYRGKLAAEHNPAKIMLYLSFFPQIMEGPISRFSEVAEELYAGKSLQYMNVVHGYQRILWGLFKKMVVADRVAAVVSTTFGDYQSYDGAILLYGVLMYTTQLYMEFSGCMDMVIGSAEIFGIKLPENFKQPFLAKDASDFWHRWHITLGTWFKDYIFYPVSLAKPVKNLAKKCKNKFGKGVSKFVAPTVALFCVWSSNGLWHGARWTYLFYGMYYFVIIFLENITEEPVQKLAARLHINRKSRGYTIFRVIKLFVIVNIGELFFRAETVGMGFEMLHSIVTNFHISNLIQQIIYLGMDQFELIVAGIGILAVTVVGALKEKGVDVREAIDRWVLPARWVFWYAVVAFVVLFGAYGAGYDSVAMIYAGY